MTKTCFFTLPLFIVSLVLAGGCWLSCNDVASGVWSLVSILALTATSIFSKENE